MCITKKKERGEMTSRSVGKPVQPVAPDESMSTSKSRKKKENGPGAASPVAGSGDPSQKKPKGGKPHPGEKWVIRTLDMGVPKLVEEFRSLAKWTPEGMTLESFQANRDKNRYQDVPCQDKGRVVLKFPGCPNDYIHANFVATPLNPQRFICAQGPLENTQYSFWAMAIQEKVGIVIMLCNCIEMTKIKCHQYWPLGANEKVSFGEAPNQIHVTNTGMRKMSEEDKCINVTTLKVEWAEGNRNILHYQWENWPDRGVPMTKLTAVNLLSATRGSQFPILVHCSAGIGRTGTIVAIAYVLEKMMAGEDCMAMNELLKELRTQRPWSIQNELQYLYLHRVLLAYFLEKYKQLFETFLEKPEIKEKYQKWCEEYKSTTGGE